MRALLAFVVLGAGCSAVIDSDDYTPPDVRAFCSVVTCKSTSGSDHTCNALGACTDCDVDDDGYAGLGCAGLAGQSLPGGDCVDSDPDVHPGRLPECGEDTSRSCGLPVEFRRESTLEDLVEVGWTDWVLVDGPVAPTTDTETMSLASGGSGSFALVGAGARPLAVHTITNQYDAPETPIVATADAVDAFDDRGLVPTSIRAHTVNGDAYVSAYGANASNASERLVGLYRAYTWGFSVSSIDTVVSDSANVLDAIAPAILSIPGSADPLPTVAYVGARTTSAGVSELFGRRPGAAAAPTSRATGEASGAVGRLDSAGPWTAYAYTRFYSPADSRPAIALWNADLDATPSAGVFGIEEVGTGTECIARLHLAEVDAMSFYLGYEVGPDCVAHTTGAGSSSLRVFTCTEIDGCASQYPTWLSVRSGDPFDLVTVGEHVWFASLDDETPSQVRLEVVGRPAISSRYASFVVFDAETFAPGSVVEEITIAGGGSPYEVTEQNVGLVVRIRLTDGTVSTYFRGFRACTMPPEEASP